MVNVFDGFVVAAVVVDLMMLFDICVAFVTKSFLVLLDNYVITATYNLASSLVSYSLKLQLQYCLE